MLKKLLNNFLTIEIQKGGLNLSRLFYYNDYCLQEAFLERSRLPGFVVGIAANSGGSLSAS